MPYHLMNLNGMRDWLMKEINYQSKTNLNSCWKLINNNPREDNLNYQLMTQIQRQINKCNNSNKCNHKQKKKNLKSKTINY